MALFFAAQGNVRVLKDVPGPGGTKYSKGTVIDGSGFKPRNYAQLIEQGSFAPTSEAVTVAAQPEPKRGRPKATPVEDPTVETTEDSDVPSF